MEIDSLRSLIKKAIEYYDNQKNNYIKFIENQNVVIDRISNEIIFNISETETVIKEYEILGYFDNQTHIWIWGWVLNDYTLNQIKLCKDLLNYGLKLEPYSNTSEHIFIKSLLVNSRIKIDESETLEVNLAIYSYLIKDRFKFIYPYKILNNNIQITYYYIIK